MDSQMKQNLDNSSLQGFGPLEQITHDDLKQHHHEDGEHEASGNCFLERNHPAVKTSH